MNFQEANRLRAGAILRRQTRGGKIMAFLLVVSVTKIPNAQLPTIELQYIWEDSEEREGLYGSGINPDWTFTAKKDMLDWCKRIA